MPADRLLLRDARLVPVGGVQAATGAVDVRVLQGRVVEVAPRLERSAGEPVLEAGGRWAVPGLWDAHVHLGQWALARLRLDVAGTTGPDDVARRVAAHVAGLPDDGRVVIGYGYRSASWDRQPTVAELDVAGGGRPVVLVSGDAHNGWLSGAALQLLGLPHRDGALVEEEWFRVLARLDALPSSHDVVGAYRAAMRDAVAKGVVGVGDMEFERGPTAWPDRVAAGLDLLRVRTATYPDGLEATTATGLRTGDPLPGGGGLVALGPLKVIFDGSVNTATAYCCEPYASPTDGRRTRGRLNLSPDDLTALLRRAAASGLHAAVHAIGDAAVTHALDAVEASGVRGSVEHVQMVDPADLSRFGRLGVLASVQPAHLLDDRDVTARIWPERADRCFPLRSLLEAGATLALGSDAPVAPLDPWLAMAAAVHRSADEREPWNPAEQLTAAQALAASTDGRATLAPGHPGDVVLLDDDPLAEQADAAAVAAHLRSVRVAATVLGGRVTHRSGDLGMDTP